MTKPQNEIDDSQMHFDAMLYVLEDPSLDQQAFEARLEHDCRLAEILAEAVLMFQVAQKIEWAPLPTLSSSAVPKRAVPNSGVADVLSHRTWSSSAAFLVVAASLLAATFMGWQLIQRSGSGVAGLRLTNSEVVSEKSIVLAWGDIQSEQTALHTIREPFDLDQESSLAVMDSNGEGDVPEWLVLATSDRVDGGFDSRDGKGLLQ